MTNSLFWFDFETFGTTPKCDRPAQFAGVRTNMDLEIIGDPVMLFCKPSLDAALPSVESCLITGITPAQCETKGVTEREFAAIIERELAQPGTIGVGYNNIRFDDEVVRYLFWRNLIDPYAREWQNQCGRWDILDMVRGMYAFFPDSLKWPRNADGAISFKLADLSAANDIAHANAHDALSDVYATIGMARLIKTAQPKFFNFCLGLRNKETVKMQLSMDAKCPLLHISGKYGVERSCLALVWPLAMHPKNKNEVIVWDLASDPAELQNLTAKQIQARVFVKNEDLPNNVTRIPIKTISINKSPFVVNDLRVLSPERIKVLKIDMDTILKHAENAKNLKLASNLWAEVYQRDKLEAIDVDEDLYNGFLPDKDRYLLNRLRSLNGEQLAAEPVQFTDKRLIELFFRYRARNFPESLSRDEQHIWLQYCNNKLNSHLETYKQGFALIAQKASAQQQPILDEIKIWLEQRLEALRLSTM